MPWYYVVALTLLGVVIGSCVFIYFILPRILPKLIQRFAIKMGERRMREMQTDALMNDVRNLDMGAMERKLHDGYDADWTEDD